MIGAKIISQGIRLTLKVKVPCLEHLNIHFNAKITKTPTQALYNDELYIHTGFAAIMSSTFLTELYYAPIGLLGSI